MGRTSDTSLDKDWGIRLGFGSRQSRDLPVDSKKLVKRQPIKKNNTRSGAQKKTAYLIIQLNMSVRQVQDLFSWSSWEPWPHRRWSWRVKLQVWNVQEPVVQPLAVKGTRTPIYLREGRILNTNGTNSLHIYETGSWCLSRTLSMPNSALRVGG